MDRYINKVVVVRSFPGFDLFDVLTLNSSTGLFEYSYNNTEESLHKDLKDENTSNAVEAVFNELTQYKPSLSKEHIIEHFEFFEDISEYEMKSKEWVEDRIEEIKEYIKSIELTEEEDTLPEAVNAKEAKTVWQNLIWELETVLGKRNHYRSDL